MRAARYNVNHRTAISLLLFFHITDETHKKLFIFVQDHLIIAYNDVKKDVVKLIEQHSKRHQFAFLFLKDFEIDHYFVI